MATSTKIATGSWSDVDSYGHPRVPFRGHYDRESCNRRRQWVEEFASCSLAHTGQWWNNEGSDDTCSCLKLKGNIEGPIGLAKVPIGIAGPLLIKGDHVKGYVLCPFATTEGALVASASRGATALTRSGGATVKVIEKSMYRCPAFKLRSMGEVDTFLKWISNSYKLITKQVTVCSQHATLIDISPTRMGRTVILSFRYDTQDAAGQNMVTSITWHICKWIIVNVEKDLPRIKILHFVIESDLSSDKTVAYLNMIRTRGVHVQVEAWIPEAILKSALKVDVKSLLETYDLLIHANFYCGAVGFNINVANTLAAVFIATGQDAACVVEASNAELIISPVSVEEIEEKVAASVPKVNLSCDSAGSSEQQSEKLDPMSCGGVYVCLTLPSLVVGTVGGGTNLATQKECLALMGCSGKNGVMRLAEIIAAFALCLDLSTLSSIASGQFATAHEKLGRNSPTHGLKLENLNDDFFKTVLWDKGELIGYTPTHIDTGNSILSELTSSEMSKKVGHFGYNIQFKTDDGDDTLQVVVKSKPTDVEVCNMINKIAQGCGLDVAMLYERYKTKTGFRFCSIREVELCQSSDDCLKMYMPQIYHIDCRPSKDLYVIVMELLGPEKFMLLNTVDDISVWSEPDIKVVLRDLAKIHAVNLNKLDVLMSCDWLEKLKLFELRPLWGALLKHGHTDFPEFWTKERMQIMDSALTNLQYIVSDLDAAPQTMIHNDCNPRNICLRKVAQTPKGHVASTGCPYEDQRCLCIYDWELATINVPQHDLVEFLAFTLPPSTSLEKWLHVLDFYRKHLEYYSGVEYPLKKFIEVYNLASLDFALNRLAMYTMVHTFKDYQFLHRVIDSHFNYIKRQIDSCGFTPYAMKKPVSKI